MSPTASDLSFNCCILTIIVIQLSGDEEVGVVGVAGKVAEVFLDVGLAGSTLGQEAVQAVEVGGHVFDVVLGTTRVNITVVHIS